MKTKLKKKTTCDCGGSLSALKSIPPKSKCRKCGSVFITGGSQNLDTARKVQEVLAQLNTKTYTVAFVPSDTTEGKMYEIRLLASNAVICNCKGWQYSKTGTCKHLEHFRANVKPSVFPGPIKTKKK